MVKLLNPIRWIKQRGSSKRILRFMNEYVHTSPSIDFNVCIFRSRISPLYVVGNWNCFKLLTEKQGRTKPRALPLCNLFLCTSTNGSFLLYLPFSYPPKIKQVPSQDRRGTSPSRRSRTDSSSRGSRRWSGRISSSSTPSSTGRTRNGRHSTGDKSGRRKRSIWWRTWWAEGPTTSACWPTRRSRTSPATRWSSLCRHVSSTRRLPPASLGASCFLLLRSFYRFVP